MAKKMLWAGLGVLALGTFQAVMIFLFGQFSETETRLLATTFVLGLTCLTAAASAGSYGEYTGGLTAFSGIVSSVFAAVLWLIYIWSEKYWDDNFSKSALCLTVIAIATAYCSVLARSTGVSRAVTVTARLTSLAAYSSAGIICYMILQESNQGELIVRILSALCVLAVAGGIATPIVRKLTAKTS